MWLLVRHSPRSMALSSFPSLPSSSQMQPTTFWHPLVTRAKAAVVHWRRGEWKRRYSADDGDDLSLLTQEDRFVTHARDARRRLQFKKGMALTIAIFSMLVILSRLPVKSYMVETSTWIRAHSIMGTVVAIVLFWIAIPLCIPSAIVEAIAGSLFGVPQAVIVILIGKTGGSWLTFLIGRRVGKAVVGDYLSTTFPTFRALSEVMNSASWKPLILFQLASIPNLFKCYALAITQVSSWRFVVSSAVGSTPHAFVWANLGSQASDIAAIVSGQSEMSSGKFAVFVGGAILTAIAMGVLIVYTKRELAELQKREYASGSEDESSPISIAIEEPSPTREQNLMKVRAYTYG